MPCYIVSTSSFLPGPPVENAEIEKYLGSLEGEAEVRKSVLSMNGIVRRHYAQDEYQQATHDVYELATLAVEACYNRSEQPTPVSFLSAGTTFAPLSGPGIASILHYQSQQRGLMNHPVEISSHSGVCTSAAAAMVAAIRAVAAGEHSAALCVGAEHSSDVLKASAIQPIDDRANHADIRQSQWFMSVFLRFMLSDGAGAFLLRDCPNAAGVSLKIDWTHSMSFAHETPLCMKLENRTARLTQDVAILSRHLLPSARKFLASAMQTHHACLESYRFVLPHISSYFFRRRFEQVLKNHSKDSKNPVPYWTNLATAGNTGAASIYVMLDQFLRENTVSDGDRFLLFIPESGQFNFVMVSVTAVVQ